MTPLQMATRKAKAIRAMGKALNRECTYCGAKPNELCRYADGREITKVDGIHAVRLGKQRYHRFTLTTEKPNAC